MEEFDQIDICVGSFRLKKTSAVMKGEITMMFGNFDISKDENNSRFVILCKEQDEKGNECWRSLIFTEEEAKAIHEYLGKNLN